MGTDVPNTITWDSYLGSQYCFVSNEFITILSYFSHQWPRDQQTFYINSQVVNSVDLVDQVFCLSQLLNSALWPQSSHRQYTIE